MTITARALPTVLVDLRPCQINQERGIPAYAMSLVAAFCRRRPDYRFLFWIDRFHAMPRRQAELDAFGTWHDDAELQSPAMPRIEVLLTTCVFVDLNGRGRDFVLPPWLLAHAPKKLAIHYDLVPYLYRDNYLAAPGMLQSYMECLQMLRQYDEVFAISASAREDAIRLAALAPDRVHTLAGDIDAEKRRLASLAPDPERPARFGLYDRYFVYIGGDDWRKNIVGLVSGFAGFSARHPQWQLAVVCKLTPERIAELLAIAADHGIAAGRLVFTGMVSDADLIGLVQCAQAMVFPSLYEGLGLPVLEAYVCGIPALASDGSSLRELVPACCRFDPTQPASIDACMEAFVRDPAVRAASRDMARQVLAGLGWESGGEQLAQACEADPRGTWHGAKATRRLALIARDTAAADRVCSELAIGRGRDLFLARRDPAGDAGAYPVRALITHRFLQPYRASVFVLGDTIEDGEVLRLLLDLRGTATGSRWLVLTSTSLRAAWAGYWGSSIHASRFLEQARFAADDTSTAGLRPLMELAGVRGIIVGSPLLRDQLVSRLPDGQPHPRVLVAPWASLVPHPDPQTRSSDLAEISP